MTLNYLTGPAAETKSIGLPDNFVTFVTFFGR
jgi:hypothetical protein